MNRLDAKDVAHRLHDPAISRWPRPRQVGGNWMTNCPAHPDKTPSLAVCDGEGDAILVNCHAGCSYKTVRETVEAKLDIWLSTGLPPAQSLALLKERSNRNKAKGTAEPAPKWRRPERSVVEPFASSNERTFEKVAKRSGKVTNFSLTIPIPAGLELTIEMATQRTWGKPSKIWTYRTAQGQAVFCIVRYDKPDGTKDIVPWVYASEEGKKPKWMPHALPEPRPMFNLDLLAENPTAPVIVHEGEKACDVSLDFFPTWIPTTSPGGANAVHMTDWRPLRGRTIIIAHDNDRGGLQFAASVAQFAFDCRAQDVRSLQWPTGYCVENGALVERPYILNSGDDIADHAARGFTHDLLKEAVALSGEPLTWPIKDIF